MNDYDDSEDYSSPNSFRARSNTWPLNRPDFAVSGGICVDETLPEIELEDDDLFTTNENWNSALVDHDIMSWDPILNAQAQQQHHQYPQQIASNNNHQITTIHHQPQPHNNQQQESQHQQNQQQQPQQQPQQQHNHHHHHHQHQHHNHPQQPHCHQRQPSIHQHHHHQQQQQQHHQQQNQQHHQHQHQQHHHHHHQQHHHQHHQQQHQLQHHQHQDPSIEHHQHIQGGSALMISPEAQIQHPQSHLQLDVGDPNEYHIQQLHRLHLDNNHPEGHYVSNLCVPNTQTNDGYISSDLQQLTSARYDFELEQQQHDHTQPNHFCNPVGELEIVDSSSVLVQSPQSDDQKQQSGESETEIKPAGSSKTKLNAPRRNAWGNMSYADLISQAINSTNDKRLTLSQIYDWMVQHVPYFKDKGDSNSSAGWKNSVRHNLSLHNRFKRLQNEGTGKSSWWTINPEANVGKCARRRAASMEASKFEKKRGRAKKRAEAVRQGLISYPSLTNSSLNGSNNTLDQQQQTQPTNHFGPPQQQQFDLELQQQQQIQISNQYELQPSLVHHQPMHQMNHFEHQEQQGQQIDGNSEIEGSHNRQPTTGLYVSSSLKSQYELDPRYTVVMSK